MINRVSHYDTKGHFSSVSTTDESITFSVPWKRIHPCCYKSTNAEQHYWLVH